MLEIDAGRCHDKQMSRGRITEPRMFVSTYRGSMSPQIDQVEPALELWTHPDPARADYRVRVTEGTVTVPARDLEALTGLRVTDPTRTTVSGPRGAFAVLMRGSGWTPVDTEREAP